jgi:flagellar hook-basal body complex protein FliE
MSSILPVGAVSQALTGITATTPGAAGATAGFGQALGGALSQMASEASQANSLATTFATTGSGSIDAVMLATAQAALAMQSASTVLSKALSAYQTIMQMSV